MITPPVCPDCKEIKFDAGIGEYHLFICLNGCEDLTQVLPVISDKELDNAK